MTSYLSFFLGSSYRCLWRGVLAAVAVQYSIYILILVFENYTLVFYHDEDNANNTVLLIINRTTGGFTMLHTKLDTTASAH